MYWWNHQSKIKKVLYGGAILCFAAGVSARGAGIIGGFLLFFILFSIALFWPEKRAKTPEEKEWLYLITPHLNKSEKRLQNLTNIAAGLLILTDIYFLFNSLLNENYVLIIICFIILIIIFNIWLMANPKYYNQIYLAKKIIPLKRETTTRKFYMRVGDIQTPYGTALMGFIPGHKEEVAVFRLVDLFWVVYYFIDGKEIHIEAARLDEKRINPQETELVYQFINELTELFCFIENTDQLPDVQDLAKIFVRPSKE